MRWILTATAMAFLGVLIFTTPVYARTKTQQVVICDQVVMVIRCGAAGLSTEQRVARVNDRLACIMRSKDLCPNTVNIAVCAGQIVIMVGDQVLVTVTPTDAQANGTTVDQLARIWLCNIRAALPCARPRCKCRTKC